MKKSLKITLIVIRVLVGIVAVDTLQAKIFNNSPLLKIRENYDGSIDYIDKGIFVNHYYCASSEEKTLFKNTKYICPIINKDDLEQYDIKNNQKITWEEITADGVNEELLFQNIDEELLTEIATELQTLIKEEEQAERENPEIVITEGWTRIFKSDRYQKVLNIGSSAMKPLYLILYKSSNAGEYEYLCANILYELSGFNFEWSNSTEFLEKFNKTIIESK